mmetsp:Transcript_75908/g.197494  ORF Transcript_75908/g.197494 Transcript_75908/m.197494 type:complete len:290 (-) Transcript_75908:1030-1899(-)
MWLACHPAKSNPALAASTLAHQLLVSPPAQAEKNCPFGTRGRACRCLPGWTTSTRRRKSPFTLMPSAIYTPTHDHSTTARRMATGAPHSSQLFEVTLVSLEVIPLCLEVIPVEVICLEAGSHIFWDLPICVCHAMPALSDSIDVHKDESHGQPSPGAEPDLFVSVATDAGHELEEDFLRFSGLIPTCGLHLCPGWGARFVHFISRHAEERFRVMDVLPSVLEDRVAVSVALLQNFQVADVLLRSRVWQFHSLPFVHDRQELIMFMTDGVVDVEQGWDHHQNEDVPITTQ